MSKWLQLWLTELETGGSGTEDHTGKLRILGVMTRSKHINECRDKVSFTKSTEPKD